MLRYSSSACLNFIWWMRIFFSGHWSSLNGQPVQEHVSPQCLRGENVTFVMDPDSKSENVKIVNIVRFKQVDRKIYLVRLKSKIQIKPKYFFV